MIPSGALAYLQSPPLSVLWTSAHTRLTRNGRVARGRLTLTCLDTVQREALSQLLACVVGATHAVDLSVLDRQLRDSAAGTGLIGVLEAVVGPVPDRRTDASVERERRALLREHANAAVLAAGLDGYPWVPEWLDRLWRQGLATRLPSAEVRTLIGQAANTLGLTVGAHARTWSRGELAQAVTGSAHGLDDDTALTRLVLRGIALALAGSTDVPAGAADRRALWDAAGVAGDTIATTVLTYGLRPLGGSWLNDRAEDRAEVHLTLREVRRHTPLRLAPQTVYVCENPRVLEAALDRGVTVPLVCTMGNPTTVTLALLDTICASGQVTLAYHGDFDWPGIAMAGRLLRRYPSRPWQLTSSHYRHAVGLATARGVPRQVLTGRPAETPWDPALAESMTELNVSIHEEALLDHLLVDLG
jgi:uncharacterized protein (TIGR02679 family)